ncbi:MAG: 5-formyltetrahydrofolate cyclo-ligase [Methanobacterium sp.]
MNTKESIRNMIWNHMEKEGISRTNSFGRIPDFYGSEKAADLLINTPEWKNTNTIFVSPDTAQRKVRENAFYDGKELIMPSPKLLEGYILLETSSTLGNEMESSTIKGAFKYGRRVKTFPMIDMVVEGSVAVDKFGGRLGKGGGYGDVEITFLQYQKVIGTETPIVSTVHESQILERVPLESHDKKINMIVTPDRVLRID